MLHEIFLEICITYILNSQRDGLANAAVESQKLLTISSSPFLLQRTPWKALTRGFSPSWAVRRGHVADFCTRKGQWKLPPSPSLLHAQKTELGKQVLTPPGRRTKEGLHDKDSGECVSWWPLLSCCASPWHPSPGLLAYDVWNLDTFLVKPGKQGFRVFYYFSWAHISPARG